MIPGPAPVPEADTDTAPLSRVLVLGANGPTGRKVVQQALNRGYRVLALTRNPDTFPLQHEHLDIIGGDATDQMIMDDVVAGCDQVISVIGAAFTRRLVDVYSRSAHLTIEAMLRHAQRRLIVVTSAGLTPMHQRGNPSLLERMLTPLARQTFGRTVYDDMERMETIVEASPVDWTIVRPPGLTSEPGTGYAAADTWIHGGYCARDNLATMLLDQLNNERSIRKVMAVSTPGLHISTLRTIQRELLKR